MRAHPASPGGTGGERGGKDTSGRKAAAVPGSPLCKSHDSVPDSQAVSPADPQHRPPFPGGSGAGTGEEGGPSGGKRKEGVSAAAARSTLNCALSLPPPPPLSGRKRPARRRHNFGDTSPGPALRLRSESGPSPLPPVPGAPAPRPLRLQRQLRGPSAEPGQRRSGGWGGGRPGPTGCLSLREVTTSA